MDPSSSSWWPFATPPEPSPLAARVTGALAAALNTVLPPPYRVEVEGGWVWCYDGASKGRGIGLGDTLDQVLEPEEEGGEPEDWPFVDRVRSGAYYVLSGVQDEIAETTRDPWPRLPQGGMANPGTRVVDGWLHCWYGPDDGDPTDAVLRLPPIDLAALGAPAGPPGDAPA